MTGIFQSFAPPIRSQGALRRAITQATRRAEAECIASLLPLAQTTGEQSDKIRILASDLITHLQQAPQNRGIAGLIQEFSLASDEGIALMCLAEALLRIPDATSRDVLIRDTLACKDWFDHLDLENPLFINAATWGLMLTGRLLTGLNAPGLGGAIQRLFVRAGEPVIRRAVDFAMRLMGEQFVLGRTIEEALARTTAQNAQGHYPFTYSFDMLGEAAMTMADADLYYAAYEAALHAVGKAAGGIGVVRGNGISIKLSALHPRYSRAQASRVESELTPRLRTLALLAKNYDIGINIDAEEADRLELSLDLFESLARDPALADWTGLGFVVQAYGKRCPAVIDWLLDLAEQTGRRFMVRLVKGAYWDTEIKRAQVDGLTDFPVYTRKSHTDVAYMAMARRLLDARRIIFPQFATHNAQTIAAIYTMAGDNFTPGDYEFQCLHGMGEQLYEQVTNLNGLARPCRIYAPVGTHETLLPYLVRRLLENGANSSFVNQVHNPDVSRDSLIADPVAIVRSRAFPGDKNPAIARPGDLYAGRENSAGIDLADEIAIAKLQCALDKSALGHWFADGGTGREVAVCNPADHRQIIGRARWANESDVVRMVEQAAGKWAVPVAERARCLNTAADMFQETMGVLAGLIVQEAGRAMPAAIAEVRECIDFLRYYARQACRLGDDLRPLGIVACISPWNFPLSIFVGQVAGALAAGNSVIAKPAEETPLIAAEAVRILYEAGVPRDVLQFLVGDGVTGAALVARCEIAGVLFTGSIEAARSINRTIAGRLAVSDLPTRLIAETGGVNAMIVDSSALAEQVVADALSSAFDSAGQRCSALRILCLQEDIADHLMTMLKGAMTELAIGGTNRLANDVGPVITASARDRIEDYIKAMQGRGHTVFRLSLPDECRHGTFVAPTMIEIDDVRQADKEIFGPVLHVLRYAGQDLDTVISAINQMGYGLTFGLHSRLPSVTRLVTRQIHAGNIYVNRNQIGAVVGVQPFGGRGLSGTGPKAGGPLYLLRLTRNVSEGMVAKALEVAPVHLATGVDNPALCAFIGWLRRRGDAALAEWAQSLMGQSLSGYTVEFSGPVGERNVYKLCPRGVVLLKPVSRNGLIWQLVMTLVTGNKAAIDAPDHLLEVVTSLPPEVAKRICPATSAVSAALVEGAGNGILRALSEIAGRDGPVIPVHVHTGDEPVSHGDAAHFLLDEVAISTNTAAVGGNATLMTLESS